MLRFTFFRFFCFATGILVSSGQTSKIYLGGTPRWYDSFWDRLDQTHFPGSSYCQGAKLPGYGIERCTANQGCCYIPPPYLEHPSTEQCVSCQEIRGTWQGIIGTCVWTSIPTVTYYDTTYNRDGPTTAIDRCVPSAVEPAVVTFRDGAGRVVSSLAPSSPPGPLGPLSFDFRYAGNASAGTVDLSVATLLGARSLFGRFAVRASELGATLYLALGPARPPGPLPARSSAADPLELGQGVVFFEGALTAPYAPPAAAGPGGRFPPGACRHTVAEGEDLDAIARRYMLNWQDLHAFNGHLVRPDDVRPGDVLAVGRHHRVRGPCVNYQARQTGPLVTDVEVDYRCTCTSQSDCGSAEGQMQGETLYGIATRYGTSWQRLLDMNPQLQTCSDAAIVEDLRSADGLPMQNCGVLPGDLICVVPYLRNILCSAEYRRYAVVDNFGNSPGYLETFFSCSPKWSSSLSADKCCRVPRCRCCTLDKYAGMGSAYQDWSSAPTANTCDAGAAPHLQCLRDPLLLAAAPAGGGGAAALTAASLSPLCDDDCQLLCTGPDPTVRDPDCPTAVGTTAYTGRCRPRRMANGLVKNVCT